MQHYSTWFVVDYQGESEETLRSITYQVPKTPAKSGRFPELPEHPVRRKGGRGSSDLPWGTPKSRASSRFALAVDFRRSQGADEG